MLTPQFHLRFETVPPVLSSSGKTVITPTSRKEIIDRAPSGIIKASDDTAYKFDGIRMIRITQKPPHKKQRAKLRKLERATAA